jgi:hypothetical protein
MPQTFKFAPIVALVASGLVYLAGCAVTGELTPSDLRGILGSLRKNKSATAP